MWGDTIVVLHVAALSFNITDFVCSLGTRKTISSTCNSSVAAIRQVAMRFVAILRKG